MESLGNFSEILKYIKDLGFGAALGAGLSGFAYLVFCLLTNSILDINYLYVILILGALLGYGVQGILVLTNTKKNSLKNARIEQQILQEKLDILWDNVKLGRLDYSRATQITDEAFARFFSSEPEIESINLLQSREQQQISQNQEEE